MAETFALTRRPVRRARTLAARLGAELLLLALLGALPWLVFWPWFAANPADQATVPLGDMTELHYPYRRWIHQALRQGDLPLWNPFLLAGHSAVGDLQFGLFYPPSRLTDWLHREGDLPLQALEQQVVAHLGLAAVGLYLWRRTATGSRAAGLAGALVFALGGALLTFPVQQVIILETIAWLPWILLCLERGLRPGGALWRLGGGLLLATAALAGHPQTLVFVLLAVLADGLFTLWREGLGWRGLARLALMGGVAAGLSAVQWLPALEHLGETDRTLTSYQFARTGFAPRDLLGLLWPPAFGGRPLYLGLATLCLAAVALAGRTDRPVRLLWGGVALGALLLSLGGHTFLYRALYAVLPGANLFRNHERLVLLVALGLAVLAGEGLRDLLEDRGRPLARPALGLALGLGGLSLAVGLGTTLAALGAPPEGQTALLALGEAGLWAALLGALLGGVFAGRLRGLLAGRWTAGLLLLHLVLDLATAHGANNLRPGAPDQLLAPTPTVTFLQAQPGRFRVASEGLLPGDGNAGSLFGLEDIVGNTPLRPAGWRDFEAVVPEVERWRLLDVAYVVTRRDLADPRLRLVHQEGEVRVYATQLDRPGRAFVLFDWVAAGSPAAARALLATVEVRRTAVVEGPATLSPAGAGQATVTVQHERPDRLALTVRLSAPGLLVVSGSYAPGWRATVDGQPAPVLRVDRALRGVLLPAGAHQVEFVYRPTSLLVGAALSAGTLGLTLLGLGALAIRRLVPGRRAQPR